MWNVERMWLNVERPAYSGDTRQYKMRETPAIVQTFSGFMNTTVEVHICLSHHH